MDSSTRSRVAGATGIIFVALGAAAAIIGEVKDLPFAGDIALRASNEVFGTLMLLLAFAGGAFVWFSGTYAARVRQLEGGSGRLAAITNASGAIIGAFIAMAVATSFAARSGSADLASLATSILDGPGLLVPFALFVASGAVVALRIEGLPAYSMNLARLSLPLAAAYLAGAGLMLFKNYAWINDTAYISFFVWVLFVSVIGVIRWGEMDTVGPRHVVAPPATRAAAAPARTVVAAEPATVVTPARKTVARKPAARKPATRRKR